MAIRAAVGAGRARIVRQLLTESAVLSLLGGALGLVVGAAGLRALLFLNPGDLPGVGPITLDWRVIAFTLLLSVLTGVIFGIVPALHTARVGVRSGDRPHTRARGAILVAEIAIAVMLLAGAGLLVRTFIALQRVAPGSIRTTS